MPAPFSNTIDVSDSSVFETEPFRLLISHKFAGVTIVECGLTDGFLAYSLLFAQCSNVDHETNSGSAQQFYIYSMSENGQICRWEYHALDTNFLRTFTHNYAPNNHRSGCAQPNSFDRIDLADGFTIAIIMKSITSISDAPHF